MPVDKGPGDEVIGATMNRSGSFRFRATKVGAETALAQVIRLVHEAQGSKAPIQRLADQVAGIFVPVVIALALATFLVWWLVVGAGVSDALIRLVAARDRVPVCARAGHPDSGDGRDGARRPPGHPLSEFGSARAR